MNQNQIDFKFAKLNGGQIKWVHSNHGLCHCILAHHSVSLLSHQMEQAKQELERVQCGQVDENRRYEKLSADHQKLQEYSSHQAKQLEQSTTRVNTLQTELKKAQQGLERAEAGRARHFSEPGEC